MDFERLMDPVLSGLQQHMCVAYLDDSIVMNTSFEMLNNVTWVFDKLLSAGLKLKAKKFYLFHKIVQFLGYMVPEDGITTDP